MFLKVLTVSWVNCKPSDWAQLFYNELICWVRGALPVGHWHFVWVTDDESDSYVCLKVRHSEDQSCWAVIAASEIKPPFTRGPGRSLLMGISWLWLCSSARAQGTAGPGNTALSFFRWKTQASLLAFCVETEVVTGHHPLLPDGRYFISHIFTTSIGVCRKKSDFSGHWRRKRGSPLAWWCCRMMFPCADDVWEI